MKQFPGWTVAGILAVAMIVLPLGAADVDQAQGQSGLLAAKAAPPAAGGPSETITVGAGSYAVRPGGRQEPIRGPNFKGAIPTQQWFSNLAFKGKDANNEFAHPLAFKPSGSGLKICYPTISAAPGGINSSNPAKAADLELSSTDGGGSFSDVALDGYSDWFIKVAFLNAGKGMHVSYGHGSPFVYATFDSGGASITANNPTVWSQGASVLGITIKGRHYGLFGPSGSTWTVGPNKLVNNAAGKPYFSLAVLPDATPATLALFKKYAYAHVIDTKVDYKFDAPTGSMKVTFNFVTKPYEGTEAGTVTALYPHQWKYTDAKLSPLTTLTYESVRGTMKVAMGPSFTTLTPIQGILPLLPPQGITDKARMAGLVKDIPGVGGGDTYGVGKSLGKLASLSGVAEADGDLASQQACIGKLKQALEGWFTAGGKSNNLFAYHSNWGTLVGYPGGFGSDWPFNDHHFHYGYFIRAAAEVARIDPAWAAKDKWGGMVEMLIRECASPDRADKMFPFSRGFDRYEGHGWASGDAGFEAGNNEESSSESMNCWYGIAMWGAATGDTAMRDWGLYMFTTQMTAIEEYWWDVSQTNWPKGFTHAACGMVWGTGGQWGTWFSGDPHCIQGINYLPFTPGSMYLVRYPEYMKRAYASIMGGGKAIGNMGGWGDLILMYHAGQDPADAAAYLAANPNMGVEGGNSKAFLYHWIGTLSALGVNDKAVTADYPFYNVYNKAGHKTYVVYNFTAKPLTVTFSDGTHVTAATKGFAEATK